MVLRSLPWFERLACTHLVLAGLGVERDTLAYQMRQSRAGPVNVLRGVPLSVLSRLGREGLSRWLNRLAARHGIPVRQLQVVIVPAPQERQTARQITDWLGSGGHPFAIAISGGALARRGVSLKRFLGSDTVLAGTPDTPSGEGSKGLKRLLDILISGLALIALSPIMGLIAIGLLSERAPIIFSQTRIGTDRRRFRCFKFRTMLPDAEARLKRLLETDREARVEWHRSQKLRRDPRVTPLGHFLRASSLDELPQLFNILRGDMSLVGPRPVIAPEIEGYPADRAYYSSPAFADYARCVPGLTGLWQVAGRHETSHAERVRLDRWYARNRSVWLDLVILCQTVRVVLRGSGG